MSSGPQEGKQRPLATVVPLTKTCSLAPRSARCQTAKDKSPQSGRRHVAWGRRAGGTAGGATTPGVRGPNSPEPQRGDRAGEEASLVVSMAGSLLSRGHGCRISPLQQERWWHVHIGLWQRESICHGGRRKALRDQTVVVRQPTHASSGPAGDRFAVSQRQRPPAAQADQRSASRDSISK